MTDLERAINALHGHSVCLCRGDALIAKDGKGVSPLLELISEEKELCGWSAADMVVGKAAAMLFVTLGVKAVYGRVMSQSGRDYLTERGIEHSYDILADRIVNRLGTGLCPMEQAVFDIDDPEQGYCAICQTVETLRNTFNANKLLSEGENS